MCMKTLEGQTKCLRQKAKIKRKSEEFVGHFRQTKGEMRGSSCLVLGSGVSGAGRRNVSAGESKGRWERRRAAGHLCPIALAVSAC